MSRIESVSVATARVPLDHPVTFSTRTVLAREYCLVKVRSDDGVEGIGYCYAVNTAGRLLAVAVTDLLGPMLVGQESLRVEGLWQEMYQEALLLGRAGAVMRALSALDTALWDLNARAAGLPLYRYLGATVHDRVPAYASGGYYLPGKTNAHLAEEMLGHVQAGFKAVKMKTGRLSPSEEAGRLAAVREAVGPDVIVMLDANNAWKDLPTALSYMRSARALRSVLDRGAVLARRHRQPRAAGAGARRWRWPPARSKRAAGASRNCSSAKRRTVLQTDATVCGGITEWRRVAATAASYRHPGFAACLARRARPCGGFHAECDAGPNSCPTTTSSTSAA